jgi:transcriptional regulator with XRE-family HTH domain
MERGTVGSKLVVIRERRMWTQARLADEAGVSPTTVSGIESGRISRPYFGTLSHHLLCPTSVTILAAFLACTMRVSVRHQGSRICVRPTRHVEVPGRSRTCDLRSHK